jgi:hypothetical protein
LCVAQNRDLARRANRPCLPPQGTHPHVSIRLPTAANESLPSLATELIDEICLENEKSWQHMQAAPQVK